MRKLLSIFLICFCIGCNNAKEKAEDALTNTIAKSVEAKTGVKVDLGDRDRNNGSVVFEANSKTYLDKDEKMQAVAIFQKEADGLAISFQLAGQEGKSLIAMVKHIPEDFTLPLTAKFAVSNSFDGVNPVATVILMEANEHGMENAPMPFEGTLTITKLTEEDMAFHVNATGGNTGDANSPSVWKPIKASGTLTSPIIQSIGIDKKDVLK